MRRFAYCLFVPDEIEELEILNRVLDNLERVAKKLGSLIAGMKISGCCLREVYRDVVPHFPAPRMKKCGFFTDVAVRNRETPSVSARSRKSL